MKPVIGSVTVLMGLLMGVTGCANADEKSAKNITVGASQTQSHTNNQSIKPAFDTQTIATLNEPWAMTVIAQANKPRQFLVTQKSGKLLLIDETGEKRTISGVPAVAYGGQGGLGDVILAPDFATSYDIYLSYAEAGDNVTAGAKVIKATIKDLDSQLPSLVNIRTIWTQTPKVTGQGHFSHKLLISPDKKYLFISSGDRQKFTPAQDMSGNLGKIIRLGSLDRGIELLPGGAVLRGRLRDLHRAVLHWRRSDPCWWLHRHLEPVGGYRHRFQLADHGDRSDERGCLHIYRHRDEQCGHRQRLGRI